MIRRFFILIVSLTFPLAAANGADLPIKKKILENCDEAMAELGAMTVDPSVELIPYLKLVLQLNTSVPPSNALEPIKMPIRPGMMDNSMSDPMTNTNWKPVDPTRDLNAKRCAMRIALALGGAAFEIAPEIIKATAEPRGGLDLLTQAEETLLTLSRSVDGQLTDLAEITSNLLSQLSGPQGDLVESVFVELGDKAPPLLLNALSLPNPEQRHAAGKLMRFLDNDGTTFGPQVLPLLGSADEKVRVDTINLLSAWPAVASASVPVLIDQLDDLSSEVRTAAAKALLNIGQQNQNPLPLKRQTVIALVDATRDNSKEVRQAALAMLHLVPTDSNELDSAISSLLKTKDYGAHIHALRLSETRSKVSAELLNRLGSLAGTGSNEERVQAVRVLGGLKSQEGQVVPLLASALDKRGQADEVLWAVAEAVSRLAPVQGGNKLVHPLILALGREAVGTTAEHASAFDEPTRADDIHPVVKALAALGSASEESLRSALKGPNPLTRRRAATTLGLLGKVSIPTQDALVALLKDQAQDLRTAARVALVRLQVKPLPSLGRLLKEKNEDARLAGALTLADLGEKTPPVLETIAAAIAKANCAEKPNLTSRLPPGNGPAIAELIGCLSEPDSNRGGIVRALVLQGPLPGEASGQVLNLVKNDKLNENTVFRVLANAQSLGLPAETAVPLIVDQIKRVDDAKKLRLVGALGAYGANAKDAEGTLKDLFEDNKKKRILSIAALIALYEINPDATDIEKFILDELSSERYTWTEEALLRLEPSTAVAILSKGLKRDSTQEQARVAHAAGLLGPAAKQLVPIIETRLDSPDRELQFQAVVALGRIDPTHPRFLEAFRRQLIRAEGRKLLSEQLSDSLIPTFEAIIKAPQSRLESFMATKLLERVKAKS